jgi:hypothetical protein
MFGLEQYSNSQYILTAATLLGAFGGFPDAPEIFKKFTKNELVQWGLVFVLLYQGGSGQDIKLSLIVTVAAFLLHKYVSRNTK